MNVFIGEVACSIYIYNWVNCKKDITTDNSFFFFVQITCKMIDFQFKVLDLSQP